MKKSQLISAIISAITLFSCRPETSDKTETKSSEEGLALKAASKEKEKIVAQNIPTNPYQPVPFHKKKQNENPIEMPTKGSVVISGYINFGDEYLKNIAKGQQKPIRNLSSEELSALDLEVIKNKSEPVETYQKFEKITNADHAYARILTLGISLASHIRCRGVFEDSDNFIVPYFNHETDSFSSVYVVKKSDGHISRYYVPNPE